MGLLCACPKSAALGAIATANCLESIGQIQKVVFQRLISETAGVLNSFTISSANPNLLASWTPLLTAADNTKVVASPYIQEPVTEPGKAITYGGGNTTLGGIPITIGREPTSFKGNILRVAQATIAAMKPYQCEDVGVYLVDEYGRIIGLTDNTTTPTKAYPIPIASLFVGDKKLGGFDSVDMNEITWNFFPNWSDKLYTITPTNFNALTALNV